MMEYHVRGMSRVRYFASERKRERERRISRAHLIWQTKASDQNNGWGLEIVWTRPKKISALSHCRFHLQVDVTVVLRANNIIWPLTVFSHQSQSSIADDGPIMTMPANLRLPLSWKMCTSCTLSVMQHRARLGRADSGVLLEQAVGTSLSIWK